MSHEITNLDDIIDSRDVIARIEELESELQQEWEDQETTLSFEYWVQDENNSELYSDEIKEYNALKALAEEAEGYSSEWIHGEALIHENYFIEYAINDLKNCGILPQDIPWYVVIDEEATAENIKQNYTTVDFDGETYYIRNT